MANDFIKLDRPLVVFDIESTGVNPRADRIIEMAAIRVHPDGTRAKAHWLVNPQVPIPIETIAFHGITDAIVADCPSFAQIAEEVDRFFAGCDLGGFNHTRFDIPILEEEFLRAGVKFEVESRRIFDAQRIFHSYEPRNLTAALRFYCGDELTDAHGAESDTAATLRVLEGQFRKYPDLPRDPDELDALLNARDPFNVDRSGRLRWVDGEITINFGKKQGKKVSDLVLEDAKFLQWILRSDFPRDTQEIIKNALAGKWPEPPPVTPTSGPARLELE